MAERAGGGAYGHVAGNGERLSPGTLVGQWPLDYFSPRNPERQLTRKHSGSKSSGPGLAWALTLGLSHPKSSWPHFPAPGHNVHLSKRLAEGPGRRGRTGPAAPFSTASALPAPRTEPPASSAPTSPPALGNSPPPPSPSPCFSE